MRAPYIYLYGAQITNSSLMCTQFRSSNRVDPQADSTYFVRSTSPKKLDEQSEVKNAAACPP
jgi:hypothetical protein